MSSNIVNDFNKEQQENTNDLFFATTNPNINKRLNQEIPEKSLKSSKSADEKVDDILRGV